MVREMEQFLDRYFMSSGAGPVEERSDCAETRRTWVSEK